MKEKIEERNGRGYYIINTTLNKGAFIHDKHIYSKRCFEIKQKESWCFIPT